MPANRQAVEREYNLGLRRMGTGDFATLERQILSTMSVLQEGVQSGDLKGLLSKLGSKQMERPAPTFCKFHELSDKAKVEARNWYKDMYGIETDSIYEMMKTELKCLGYPVGSIDFNVDGNVQRTQGVAVFGAIDDWRLCKIARRLLTPRKEWYLRKAVVGGAEVSIRLRKKSYVKYDINVSVESDNYRSNRKSDLRNLSTLMNEFESAIQGELTFVTKQLEKKAREMYAELVSPEVLDAKISEKDFDFKPDGSYCSSRERSRSSHYAYYA